MPSTSPDRFATGLTLIEAPDLTALTVAVLDDLDALMLGPFDAPMVMVRHHAVRRHLVLAVASRDGIAASLDLPSPTTLLERLHGTASRSWTRGALAWRITALLPTIADRLPESIARSATHADPMVRISFARRLAARLFDAMLHRPGLVAAWERGSHALGDAPDEAWQAALWQELTRDTDEPSLVARHLEWKQAVNGGTADGSRWPAVILLASDATLPPLLRDALHTVATRQPVRWHLLVPDESTSDSARSRRRPAALAAVRRLPGVQRVQLERRHPLADQSTVLGAVQRRLGGELLAPASLHTSDTTLRAHRCHTAIRELEVIREQVAWHLGQDPTLEPHDITLYLTDLEGYLPAVDAVFGTHEPGLPRLHYEVAGRPWRNRSTIGAAVTALLDALAGRFGRREILSLLEHPPIRNAAGIRAEELHRLDVMAEEARIRWGIDGAHRVEGYELPALEDGTWRAGLANLKERYPSHPELDDPEADRVTRLDAWVERLIHWRSELSQTRPVTAWPMVIDGFLTAMVRAWGSDDAEALKELRQSMATVLDQAASMDGAAQLTFGTLTPLVAEALESDAVSGHLRGGIRVCRLEPGAVLPARVVCIAGLDDGRFPRGGGTPPWDILLQSRHDWTTDPLEAEDPDPREEALDAFRDAICSASDAVHLTWTGRSITDNALRSPSVAVSEVFDTVDQFAATADESQPHLRLLIDEPLQPFAPRLFGAASDEQGPLPLQSASRRWATAAEAVLSGDRRIPRFLDAPLASAGPLTEVTLDHLARAFSDPPTWFWRQTLGLPLPLDRSVEEDTEPILLDDHDTFAINAAVLRLAGNGAPLTTEAIRRDAETGYGEIGPAVLAARRSAQAVAIAAARHAGATRPIQINVAETLVRGELTGVDSGDLLQLVHYPVSARTILGAWVRHLALNAAAGAAISTLIGIGSKPDQLVATLRPVSDPLSHLERIVALFATLRREPVPLFPKAALAAAEALEAQKDEISAALRKWRPTFDGRPGEGQSPIMRRLFAERDLDPVSDPELWNRFLPLVTELVQPLIGHLKLGTEQ